MGSQITRQKPSLPERLKRAETALLALDGPEYWNVIGRESILSGWRGSVAHGTYLPEDDEDSIDDIDLMSIVVPGLDYYFGNKEFGSRGTKELTREVPSQLVKGGVVLFDCVHYELKKMLSMLANGNPNVLPLLWMAECFYERKTPVGEALIQARDLFSTKRAWASWKGYALSQIQHLHKGEHFGHLGEKRKAQFAKFGFDCKAASHLIRLLRMSKEFFELDHLMVFRLNDWEELVAIKRGEWTEDQVRQECERLMPLCEKAAANSKMPDQPDWTEINKLSVRLAMQHLNIISAVN